MDAEGLLASGEQKELLALHDVLADLGAETDESDEEEDLPTSSSKPTPGPGPSDPTSAPETNIRATLASSSGLTAVERLHGQRKDALVHCKGWTSQEICEKLQFQKTEIPWALTQSGPATNEWDTAGANIGVLRVTFAGRTVQALCSNPRHNPPCKLLLQCGSDLRVTEARCLRWLISGTACSKDEHTANLAVIREEHRVG